MWDFTALVGDAHTIHGVQALQLGRAVCVCMCVFDKEILQNFKIFV